MRQHKLYGEILLIHPFSLVFLSCLAISIAAASVAYLLLGHITERIKLSGVVITQPQSNETQQADLLAPARALSFVHSGEQLSVRCRGCAGPLTATVEQISASPVSSNGPSSSNSATSDSATSDSATNPVTTPASREPMYKVRVALTPAANLPQSGARVEADLPLGSKPLLHWLFEKPGS